MELSGSNNFAQRKPLSFPEPFKRQPQTCDSGYSTLHNTPEGELYPETGFLNWNILSKELDSLLVTSPSYEPQVLGPSGFNFNMTNCTFTIEGGQYEADPDPNSSLELDPESSLDIKVAGPSGILYPVTIAKEYNVLRCTFFPIEIGEHKCQVLSSEEKHFSGSPFVIKVFRDYSKITGPVVTLDIEISTRISTEEDSDVIQVRKPWGIACNVGTEQILVADREHHEILVFKPEGDLDFTFGKRGSGPGEFFRPTSIVFDSVNSRIMVGDKDNHRVQIFNEKGTFLFTFGVRGFRIGQFLYPWGLAVSKCGKMIAVADTRNHRIQLFTSTGQFLRQYPVRPHKAELNHPRGVTFDLAGEYIFVSDFNLNCIFKLDINFTSCTRIVSDSVLKRPQGLDVDSAGNLLVTDSRHNCVKVFLPNGTFLQEFNRFSPATVMDLPLDLATMRAGFVAILDLNGRINIV